MIRIPITALFLILSLAVFCQENYQQRLYRAFVEGEMYQWKTVIYEMEEEYRYSRDRDLLYELCFTYYGYVGYLMKQEEKQLARQFLDRGSSRTRDLEQVCGNCWDVHALRGALLGLRVAIDKYKAAFLGPKAMRHIRTAYSKSPSCFNCNLEMGNFLFNAPRIAGGSKTRAIPYYKMAKDLLEDSSHKRERHWIYLNSTLMLANAYLATGQDAKARNLCIELLEYEPKADWIRKEYLTKDAQ